MILISSIFPLSKTWNSAAHELIIPLTPWPSFRHQPGILETSPHIPCTNTPCTQILCGPRMARPPARNHKRDWKDSTPAIGVHTPNVASTAHKDLSNLTCFNSDRKGHYATKCPKPKKNKGYSRMNSVIKFRAFNTLPPSEKNLCWLYLTQEMRSMPYTLPLLKNWASESGQLRKIPWRDIFGG